MLLSSASSPPVTDRTHVLQFRPSVLVFWAGGDFIKLVYYVLSPGVTTAFRACACFQLSVDFLLLAQTYLYRRKTAQDMAELARLRDEPAGVAGPEAAFIVARQEEGRGLYDEPRESGEYR